MALVIGSGITLGSGITVTSELSGLILNLDASNPSSYSGTGTTWYDLSGAGNDATLTNSPPWTSDSNQSYFTFQNSAGYAQLGAILPNTTYTKIGVIRVTGTFENFMSGDGGGNEHAFWGFSTEYLQSGHNGNWSTVVSTNPVPTSQWVFAAVSFSSVDGWRLYLNTDTPVTNASTDQFVNNPANVEIGGYDGDANNLRGDVALAQIYNRALSDSEVAAIYATYQSRFGY